jgi:DNA topoisomerase-1
MESQLDDVARGENPWVPMVRSFWEPFNEQLLEGRTKIAKQVELTDIICPVSGHQMVKRFGRNGWFLGCSGYPECKQTMPLPGEETDAAAPPLPGVGEDCPLCGQGHLVARTGRFGPFVGCDRYPDCRYIKKDAAPAAERFGTCPKCGQGTVVTKRGRRGRRPFWGCDRYPDCDYATWTRPTTAATPAGADGDASAAAASATATSAAAADGETIPSPSATNGARRRATRAGRRATVADGRGG